MYFSHLMGLTQLDCCSVLSLTRLLVGRTFLYLLCLTSIYCPPSSYSGPGKEKIKFNMGSHSQNVLPDRIYTKLTLVTNSRRSGNCCRITWFVYSEANLNRWGEEEKGGLIIFIIVVTLIRS